jgi:DNA-binding TFAR19-related protein (PDSD5 family)
LLLWLFQLQIRFGINVLVLWFLFLLIVCLEQLDDAVGGEKTDTDKNMSTMFNILREKKRVLLEHLILNRISFAQTVENLFTLSFLVKDGRAEIIMDKNRLHYVCKTCLFHN